MPRNKSREPAKELSGIVFKVNEILKELRPNLLADGGNIEFVEIENGILKVRLKGACAKCPMKDITLKWGVERLIKERIPEIHKVEPVS